MSLATHVNRTMGSSQRRVVLRHPRTFDAILYRKTVLRDEPQLLGGAMVLSSDDEPEFKYTKLGAGKMLFVDQYGGASLVDNQGSVDYGSPSFHALIEPIANDETESGFFVPKKTDIVYASLGEGLAIAFEITGMPATFGMQAFGVKYELTKRDDLTYAEFTE